MRIGVTGGSGFIGSHTCASLLNKGNEVYILDSLSNSSEKCLENIIESYKKMNLSKLICYR